MNSKSLSVIMLFAYSALIYWLSDQSSLPVPLLFPNQDKLHHFIAFLIMGWLSWRCFDFFIIRRNTLTLTALSYCLVFALTDEWHQSFVPGRSADVFDWMADAIGSMIVIEILRKQR